MLEPEGKTISTKVDIWMLGCLAYILVFVKQPFTNRYDIIDYKLDFPSDGLLTSLIKEMMQYAPKKRPSAEYILRELNSKIIMITEGEQLNQMPF